MKLHAPSRWALHSRAPVLWLGRKVCDDPHPSCIVRKRTLHTAGSHPSQRYGEQQQPGGIHCCLIYSQANCQTLVIAQTWHWHEIVHVAQNLDMGCWATAQGWCEQPCTSVHCCNCGQTCVWVCRSSGLPGLRPGTVSTTLQVHVCEQYRRTLQSSPFWSFVLDASGFYHNPISASRFVHDSCGGQTNTHMTPTLWQCCCTRGTTPQPLHQPRAPFQSFERSSEFCRGEISTPQNLKTDYDPGLGLRTQKGLHTRCACGVSVAARCKAMKLYFCQELITRQLWHRSSWPQFVPSQSCTKGVVRHCANW
jgi:hypothetical protein